MTCLLLSLPCLAGGPKYRYQDAKLDDEINNIYHDIESILKGDVRIASATISNLTYTGFQSTRAFSGWTAYTPTVSNNTNMSKREGFWSRVGDSMLIRVGCEWNGAGGGADFTVAIPSGFAIDTAKLPTNTVLSLGNGQWYDASVSRKIVAVRYNSTTVVSFDVSGGTSLIQGTDFADQDDLTFQIIVPISGWTF